MRIFFQYENNRQIVNIIFSDMNYCYYIIFFKVNWPDYVLNYISKYIYIFINVFVFYWLFYDNLLVLIFVGQNKKKQQSS